MDRTAFSSTQQAHFVKTLNGADAFVPPPLPPKLDLAEFALELGATGAAMGELKGAARRLSNPYMLIGPLKPVQPRPVTAARIADSLVAAHPHNGFWQLMDAYRESRMLRDLWDSGDAPWETW